MTSATNTLLQSPPATNTNTETTFSTKRLPAATIELTCHKCGAEVSHSHVAIAEDAQHRIAELEAQVRILTGKATAAVDKLADYEDELRQLKSSSSTLHTNSPDQQRPKSSSAAMPPTTTPTTTTTKSPLPSRLSSLLPSSRSTSQPSPHQTPNPPPVPSPSSDLTSLLTHERTLRLAAERLVSQTNAEIEELSAQLFSEANEMVASERKARKKLEERVEVLEGREREKRGRLEVLEGRVRRVERVRGLLGGGNGGRGGGG